MVRRQSADARKHISLHSKAHLKMSSTDTLTIDPARPWILDPRDAPAEMNWRETLFYPFGLTSKVHFGRAWTFMFMGRLLLFVVPVFAVFILNIAGMKAGALWKPLAGFGLPIPTLLLPFFVFATATEFTSFVAHRRRLANAKRSPWLGILVLVPLILAMAGFVIGAGSGAKEYDTLKAEENKPQIEQTLESASSANGQEDAKKKNGKKREGPPPTQKEMASSAGMGLAIPIWMLSSFFVMLWTLLYVARLPNDGVGKIQTGTVEPT